MWTEHDRDRLIQLLAQGSGGIDLAETLAGHSSSEGSNSETLEGMARTIMARHPLDPEVCLARLSGGLGAPCPTGVAPTLTRIPDPLELDADPFATRLPGLDETFPAPIDRASEPGRDAQAGHRFDRIRPHAKGGLGEVFVAHDRELRRIVALKEIQDRHADHQQNRARFVLEAEITGSLEHPGIIPVYGLGQYEDGRPYYAMRFIQGDSLQEALERFHAADAPGRDPGERALALRGLLGRFLDVCNAMAYAHSKGVLHRDLKPSNVMLGPFGETLVVDWGLAKVQGQPDVPLVQAIRAAEGIEDRDARPSGPRSGSAETLPGAAMGTPQYMSPEQARGDLERLGPTSDVYSLGASLYTLLAGRPAFEDRNVLTVIEKVIRGEFEGPRHANRKVPHELDAICRKAMSHRPEDRYPSAKALAEDVEHWMADEPVGASPDSRRTRVRRWFRRHRIIAWSSIGSLVAITGLSAVGALMIARERDQAHDSRIVALAERGHAKGAEAEAHRQAKAARSAQSAVALEKEKALGKLYATSVALAYQEWQTGNVARAEELLDACPDRLRGWEWRHLKGLCHSELKTFRDHSSTPNLVSFSSDGTRVYSADLDGIWKEWGASAGRMIRSTSTHSVGLAFDRGRRRAVAASESDPNLMTLQDPAGVSPPRSLRGPDLRSFVAGLSPDGLRMALSVEGSKVRIWDIEAGAEVTRLVGRAEEVGALDYSPDGRLLAVGRLGGWVELWELEGSKRRVEFLAHPNEVARVHTIAFSPDGRSIATAASDGTARIWDPSDGRLRLVIQGHRGFINTLCYSPDGRRIATGGSDRTVRIWDASTGRELANFRGHSGEIADVSFSPEGDRLLSASHDTTLKLWDARVGSDPSSTNPPEGSSEDDRPESTLVGHDGTVAALSFRHDGQRLATVGWDGRLIVHDLAQGRRVLVVPDAFLRAGQVDRPLDTSLGSVAYSPDGRRIAVGSGGLVSEIRGIVRALDAESGREAFVVDGLNGPVSTLAYSPDGRWLLIATGAVRGMASVRPSVQVREAEGGRLVSEFQGQTTAVLDGDFSPDGRRVATTALGTTVRIWDPLDGKELLMLGRHGNALDVFRGVAWSPDGKTLAAAGADSGVRLFDTTTGRDLGKLRGHSDQVYKVAFSPDGARLASTGRDASVKVWDVASGDEMLTFRDHSAEVYDVAFSPHGRTLASAGFDGTIRLRVASGPAITSTDDWDVLLVDRFDRAEIGDRWTSLTGRWSIEDGSARGELGPMTGTEVPLLWATLCPKGLHLPSTSEVRFEVWTDSAINMEAKFHDTATRSPHNGISTLIAGTPTPFNKGDLATTILVQVSGTYHDLLSNPRFTLEKGVRRRIRVLREPKRLTIWIDGVEAASYPVPELDVPYLHLQAGFGEPGSVVHLDDVEVRAPRGSARERVALGRVFGLFDREPLKSDVLEALKSDLDLDPITRSLAIAMAARRIQGPQDLNRIASPVVASKGRTLEEYRVALIRIEEAHRLSPGDDEIVDSLGVALYRAGRFEAASEQLEQADRDALRRRKVSSPTNLSFRAMAQAKLGRMDEARSLLDRVGEQVGGSLWARIPEASAVKDEAEDVVGSKAATHREQTLRNLNTLARAIHDDFEARKALLAPAILAADGRPLLSWRVALLPYLGQKQFYEQFHLDEPWDGPHNRALVDRMPDVFGPASRPGSTHFRVFTGPSTAFPASGLKAISEIRDGLSLTMLVVESTDEIPWTRPDDLPYSADRPLPRLGVEATGRASLMLADGALLTIRPDPAAEAILRGLITRDGGESIDLTRLPR